MSELPQGSPALFGLVLAGGESRRMGRDKGLIAYRGDAHRQVLYTLLRSVCDRVFLSVNAGQPMPEPERFAYLVDAPEYAGNGPIGAVMGFRDAHPGVALLLVSCDLPFFGPQALQALLAARDTSRPGTAFLNPENNRPEPLVTIYEPRFLERLAKDFGQGTRSMQRILLEDPPALIRDFDARWIRSADTPEDVARAGRLERRSRISSRMRDVPPKLRDRWQAVPLQLRSFACSKLRPPAPALWSCPGVPQSCQRTC